jgi:hypothetical protein
MRRTAVKTLEGAVSFSRARIPLSRSFATVKDPDQKVPLIPSIMFALVLLLILFTRTRQSSIISQNSPMAFAWPPNRYLDLFRPLASISMQARDTKMKVYEV